MSIFDQLLTEKVFLLTDGAARQMKFDKNLTQDGLSLYVDAVALNYLKGTEIDFVAPPTGASFVSSNVFATPGGTAVFRHAVRRAKGVPEPSRMGTDLTQRAISSGSQREWSSVGPSCDRFLIILRA